jgi:eukaryotic-like serine/threonine-protein kinase
MTDRWEQVESLCQAALELEESLRPAFLAQACAGDEEMRREVESLLKFEKPGNHFIEQPALEAAAKMIAQEKPESLIGQQLGSYQIVSLLGTGGMGVVYQARDTRLKRSVAMKVLPRDMMSDPERKRRFIQEARAASALNHPNIITIYDIGNEVGTDFIVMEYVAGKTLDQRIPRKGMRLDEALKIAVQIADALAKAHSAGIIHRDLKPTNVMVTDDGLVKVLDFGLAKLTEVSASSDERTLRSETEEGTIVGTVSYMLPEQAEGTKVDARSDIFSFGAVLYEMVTGQKAFQGESKMSTLTAVLKQEPKPISQLVPTIPLDLEKTINRCLRKDRERRYQYMADVKINLQELKEESDSGPLAGTQPVVRPVHAVRRNRRRPDAGGEFPVATGIPACLTASPHGLFLGPTPNGRAGMTVPTVASKGSMAEKTQPSVVRCLILRMI